MHSHTQVILAGSVVTVSSAVVTWWLVGDLSYGPQPSPSFHVSLPESVFTLAGTISLAAMGVALWFFIKKGRPEKGFVGWLATLVFLCAATSGTAYLGRVVSAKNLGGDGLGEALAIMYGLPIISSLVVTAATVFALAVHSRSRT